MGFFHKITTGLKRTFASSPLDYVSEQKSYGNEAEFDFVNAIMQKLPGCNIKSNVIVETKQGRCEIDCLLVYKDKLFIIEVKHWKGILTEYGGKFISEKEDKYNGRIYEKELKSPFSQVKRHAVLLKEFTNSNPRINTVVYFCDADEISASNENVWFEDIDELISYVKNDGLTSNPNELSKCFSKAIKADYLYSSSFWGERSLHCIVTEESLNFLCTDGTRVNKQLIQKININHHFVYDDIEIILKDGQKKTAKADNMQIIVREDGDESTYSLAKITTIIIGN